MQGFPVHERRFGVGAGSAEFYEGPNKRMLAALGLSLALHAVFLLMLRPHPVQKADTIELTLVSLPPPSAPAQNQKAQRVPAVRPPPEQFVTPSERTEKLPPQDTAFKSETDSSVKQQQIRRGMPDASDSKKPEAEPSSPQQTAPQQAKPPQAEKPITPPQPVSPKNMSTREKSAKDAAALQAKKEVAEKAVPPKTPNAPKPTGALRLTDDVLAKQLAGVPVAVEKAQPAKDQLNDLSQQIAAMAGDARPKSDAERAKELREYEPFRNPNARNIWTGKKGAPDYLPTIQDGDVTLLNTKADRFAVFVRRVALQVWGSLRQRTWNDLNAQSVLYLQDFAIVEAVMSPQGKFISVELRTSSGVQRFDSAVLEAAKLGAWDQNPPAAARGADGNIHFVFQSRLWVRRSPDSVGQQRWLLLSTGLL